MTHKKFAREAAAALMRWYRVSSEPGQAAGLLEKAADINERIEEQSLSEQDLSPRAPDVEREG